MKSTLKILRIHWITILLLLLSAGVLYCQETPGQLFEEAVYAEEVKGELTEAIRLYQRVYEANPENRQMGARALLHLGLCYEKLGSEQASQAYRDVINKYGDQTTEVALASERISRLQIQLAELNRLAEEHVRAGNELFKRWEYEDAIMEYEQAIKLRPHTLLALNAQYCIGQTWYLAGKYDAAQLTLKNLIDEYPQSSMVPVTELMLSQVQYAKENDVSPVIKNSGSNENKIVDQSTGISYHKIKSFVGKNDLIGYLSGGANLSPDGRFMVLENNVIPLDGSSRFNLVNMAALRGIYAPDMKHAAFLADSAIWTVPVSPETGRSTGPPLKLLEGGYRFQNPVNWSPDGKQIAFTRVEENMELDIWAMSVPDGGLSRITDSPEIEGSACWSPDGKTIAYRAGSELWLTSVSGDKKTMLLKNGGNPLRWSKDNKWLFHSDWENNHLYSLDYHKNYKIDFPEQVGTFVLFSPEGTSMLFYRSSYDDKWPLKIVSSSGGASYKPLGNEVAYGSYWLGDSKHILVQGENEEGNIAFKIISIEGGVPQNIKIASDVEGEVFPFGLLPNLTQIAFSVKREDGRKDLYIASFSIQQGKTTGPARRIFEGWSGGAYNVTTAWSPDSKKLALSHEGDIWVSPLEGGNPVQITDTPVEERWVSWSPDGTLISYKVFSQSDKSETMYVIQPENGISWIVKRDCQRESLWGSDSKSILLFADKELQEVTLDGKILQHILNIEDLGLEITYSPCLSPDGKHLAFVGYEDGDKSLIIKYSLESKEIARLGQDNLSDYKYGLVWSPDGKWLSYLTYEEIKVRPEGSLWEADFEEVKQKLTSRD
jgi:Tol biopolymer transport system component/tetratricopeptide (TPR) repeat protein